MARQSQPAAIADAAPLLVAPELARHGELSRRIAELRGRIARLPRHAHRRIALEAQLQGLVAEALAIEAKIYRRPA